MKKSIIIITSVRNPKVISDYNENLEIHEHDSQKPFFLIVTENDVKKEYVDQLKDLGLEGEVFDQVDREKFMISNNIGGYIDLIPRHSHAETSFGLLYMWINKEFDNGFFIDDDTVPINKFDFFGNHLANLNFQGDVDLVSSDKKWVNVLYQSFKEKHLYPRGYPYSKMNEKIKIEKINIKSGQVYISQGLWTNIPDLDAIRILMDGDLNGQSKTRMTVADYKNNFVSKVNNYQTVCSMNLAFRRAIIPAFYQMPMDSNPYKIGRFDDIWSGLIAKKVLDKVGGYIINGYPLCEHNKTPRSTFKDLNAEAPGYESNEHFSESIDMTQFKSTDIPNITKEIAFTLSEKGRTDFIKYCATYLHRWVEMCEKVG